MIDVLINKCIINELQYALSYDYQVIFVSHFSSTVSHYIIVSLS